MTRVSSQLQIEAPKEKVLAVLTDFGVVEEQGVGWMEDHSFTYDIQAGAGPIKSPGGYLSVSESSDGTLVTMTMDFKTKFGPLGGLRDMLNVRGQMEEALGGLKHHVETDELVGDKVL